jgi:hypothetical protein
MKKYVLQLLILLAFSSPAFANSFGVHFTYPVTVGLQYSISDAFGENTALRFWGNASLEKNAFAALVQIDDLFGRYAIDPEGVFALYYGVGGHVGFGTASSTYASASVLLLGLQGTTGIAFNMTNTVQVFLEASAGYSFGFVTGSSGSSSAMLPLLGLSFYRYGLGLDFKL